MCLYLSFTDSEQAYSYSAEQKIPHLLWNLMSARVPQCLRCAASVSDIFSVSIFKVMWTSPTDTVQVPIWDAIKRLMSDVMIVIIFYCMILWEM